MAQQANGYPCPTCGSKNTTATYYHACIKHDWVVEKCPAPDQTLGPGKLPAPVSCPDGLLDCRDNTTRRDATPPMTCTNPGPIQASQLHCLHCKTTTVYQVTRTRRPVTHHRARK
ncbi:MAG: hypothetical protein NTX53_16410 [candidate division WOR-3 bacterium]|nr:hypothetical protein [candidate division WOR-3 bacterium]